MSKSSKKQNSLLSVSTPQLLWHGGGNANGKPDPVYSVDFLPSKSSFTGSTDDSYILCTTGIDANVPPKGSVRLWKISPKQESQEFLIDLIDHQTAVNIARFSPCGKMLASASDRQIVVYTVSKPELWSQIDDSRVLEKIWLRPSLSEVFDLEWSADSSYIIIGAVETKAEILRLSSRQSLLLPGHTSYVQGVTWDPLNQYVVTQSSDRTCKVHQIKQKDANMVKLDSRGHNVLRMHNGYNRPSEDRALSAEDFGVVDPLHSSSEEPTPAAAAQGINLFADAQIPSFFRRLSFSPDGLLLVCPAGLHRPPQQHSSQTYPNFANSSSKSTTVATRSFCTHIFSRFCLTSPCLSLIGLEDPSVAVRFCPLLFRPLQDPSAVGDKQMMIDGDYRMIFAVVTIASVFLYDTQHSFPFAKLTGLHLAPINDATWGVSSKNSRSNIMLTVCSSDGYLTFVRFEAGALGEPISAEAVPESVRRAHPYLYNYQPPVVPVAAKEVAGEIGTEAAVSSVNPAVIHPVGAKRSNKLVVSDEDEEKEEENPTGPSTIEQVVSIAPPAKDDKKKKKKRIQPVIVARLGDGLPKEVETVAVEDIAQPPKDALVVVEYSPAEYPSVHHSSTIPHGISIIANDSDPSPDSVSAPTAVEEVDKKEVATNDTLSKHGSPCAAISGEPPIHPSPSARDGGEVKAKKRIVPTHVSPAPVSVSTAGMQ